MFEEFDTISAKAWKEKIIQDLKGKSFEDTLIWGKELGFNLQPNYHKEDLTEIISFPVNTNGTFWQCQSFSLDDAEVNKKILTALNQGVNGINLTGNLSIKALHDVNLNYIAINFYHSENPIEVWTKLSTDFTVSSQQNGCLNLVGNNHQLTAEAIETLSELPPLFRGLIVNSEKEKPTDKLADLLKKGNHLIEQLLDKNWSIDDISAKIQFNLTLSNHYFFEIAFIRALRYLWANIINAYQPKHHCSKITFVACETDPKTKDGGYSDLISSTTQAMAAMIGGADSLTVRSHNNSFDDDGLRYARNVQNILLEEAYSKKVMDPAKGSYFIENLTREIANMAWEIFTSSK